MLKYFICEKCDFEFCVMKLLSIVMGKSWKNGLRCLLRSALTVDDFWMFRPVEWRYIEYLKNDFSIVGLHCISATGYAHLWTVIKLYWPMHVNFTFTCICVLFFGANYRIKYS